jgi:hypothetical protein
LFFELLLELALLPNKQTVDQALCIKPDDDAQ